MQKRRGARLGQHFLTHAWAARTLAHAAEPKNGEDILEIGPGKGVLTRELLTLGTVVAVEKDPALVVRLRETFADEIAAKRLILVEQDVRDATPQKLGLKKYVVAANIPYYITGEIIRQFLTAAVQPRAMALLVQKEVADRIVARDGKESILSISVKVYGSPRIVAKVGRSHFSPPPSVDSAILLIGDISKKFFGDISEEAFFGIVRTSFASKRKMLMNNLATKFERTDLRVIFTACGIAENARAEDVTLAQWRDLATALTAGMS